MEIDIYQQCPCHSGKKIKFCCGKDIVHELNQIVAKCNSNQSLSALDQIDRVIAKHGEKDSLLTLKTHILFTLNEIEKATACNQRFVARNPNHPVGRQHEAMTALAHGEVAVGINKMQDAMDLVKGEEIPLTMANAFRLLGSVLLNVGHLIAARAHLQFALMIRGEASPELQQLLQESFRMQGAPLALKTDFRLEPAPSGMEWSTKYENVIRAMNRGQFRLALKMLQRIDEHWPEQKEVVRGIAVVHSMLADETNMSAAWHRAACLKDIPKWQAVESESLSQIFLEQEPSGTLDVVASKFLITSLDAVFASASSSPRLVASECPVDDPFEDGPAPRYSYYVLDRNQVESSEDLQATDVPMVVGEMLLYGKQTDRGARLVFYATKNDSYGPAVDYLKTLFADQLDGAGEEQILSTTSVAADILSWNWHVPPGTRVDQHRELIHQYQRYVLLEKWPAISFSCLDGMTPNQVIGKPEFEIPLAALVLNLEQSVALQLSGDDNVVELKSKLGIPEAEKLDASVLADGLLTPLRLRQVEPSTLSDDQMLRVYSDSITIANTYVLKRIVPEILERDSMAEKIPRDICYSMLAQLTDDNQQAIEYLQKARQEAKKSGRSIGLFLVQEFEIRLSRGITDKLPELLDTIQKQHLSDPNVEYQLARVLTKFGLISPDGRMVSLPRVDPAEEKEVESMIWTPDSPTAPVASSSSASDESAGSKLWIPGSD